MTTTLGCSPLPSAPRTSVPILPYEIRFQGNVGTTLQMVQFQRSLCAGSKSGRLAAGNEADWKSYLGLDYQHCWSQDFLTPNRAGMPPNCSQLPGVWPGFEDITDKAPEKEQYLLRKVCAAEPYVPSE